MPLGPVATNRRREAHGRDGDRLLPNASTAGMGQDPGRLDHPVVVVKRLPLAHEHSALEPSRRLVSDHAERRDHLPGLQIAAEPQAARGAERTAHGAPHLGRQAHAERVLGLQGDPDRLAERSVRGPEEVFHEPVVRVRDPLDDLEVVPDGSRSEDLASRLPNGKHRAPLLGSQGQVVGEKAPHLAKRHPLGTHLAMQVVGEQPSQVDRSVHLRLIPQSAPWLPGGPPGQPAGA